MEREESEELFGVEYAAFRCGHLEACVCFFFFYFFGKLIGDGLFRVGHWPPNPDTNYRCVCVFLLFFLTEGVLMVRFGY